MVKGEGKSVEDLIFQQPVNGNDIITFNFKTFGTISLIFHTGPKGKDTHDGKYLFNTYSENIEWVADKRFILKIADKNWIDTNGGLLKELILEWVDKARNNFEYEPQ